MSEAGCNIKEAAFGLIKKKKKCSGRSSHSATSKGRLAGSPLRTTGEGASLNHLLCDWHKVNKANVRGLQCRSSATARRPDYGCDDYS